VPCSLFFSTKFFERDSVVIPAAQTGVEMGGQKVVEKLIWKDRSRKVVFGRLEPVARVKPKIENLFLFVGEKLPFECLPEVRRHVYSVTPERNGVYMAHD
jgi:hypothetical protein